MQPFFILGATKGLRDFPSHARILETYYFGVALKAESNFQDLRSSLSQKSTLCNYNSLSSSKVQGILFVMSQWKKHSAFCQLN